MTSRLSRILVGLCCSQAVFLAGAAGAAEGVLEVSRHEVAKAAAGPSSTYAVQVNARIELEPSSTDSSLILRFIELAGHRTIDGARSAVVTDQLLDQMKQMKIKVLYDQEGRTTSVIFQDAGGEFEALGWDSFQPKTPPEHVLYAAELLSHIVLDRIESGQRVVDIPMRERTLDQLGYSNRRLPSRFVWTERDLPNITDGEWVALVTYFMDAADPSRGYLAVAATLGEPDAKLGIATTQQFTGNYLVGDIPDRLPTSVAGSTRSVFTIAAD